AMDEEARKKTEMLKSVTRQQYDAAIRLGKQQLQNKQFEAAIISFTKASQLLPEEKEAIALLTQARETLQTASKMTPDKAGSKESSKSPAKEAAKSEPSPLARAQQLQKQQKWQEALAIYREILQKQPGDSVARNGARVCEFQLNLEAGKAALQKNEKEEAIQALEAALKLAPGHPETLRLLKQARELK
ncbi:MAG TPA: tetratricopeptide repeat protein, partial [Gemmatales bacterium]|nr:tetratricopeptide repeat protein [Gemmatales bacterium]